jgi:nucleoside-diphosphate-sugar epimerase
MHKDGVVWDYIFCFSLENKLGLPEQAYEYGTLRPALHAAEYALQHEAILVFASTALCHVTLPQTQLATENTPYTLPTGGHTYKYALLAEKELRQVEGLKLVVIRDAIPYGPDHHIGFCTVSVLCRIFKDQGEPMSSLVGPSARLRCVHIRDLARAYWHTANTYVKLGRRVCVYNVACPDDLTEGRLVDMVAGYYGIPVRKWNPIIAKLMAIVRASRCLSAHMFRESLF